MGVVPKFSTLLREAIRTPSNHVSDSPEAPLILTLTWTSCHAPGVMGVELVVDTAATSFRYPRFPAVLRNRPNRAVPVAVRSLRRFTVDEAPWEMTLNRIR